MTTHHGKTPAAHVLELLGTALTGVALGASIICLGVGIDLAVSHGWTAEASE